MERPWSDNGEGEVEKTKDETCLVAQAPDEICLGINLEPDEWIKDSGCSKNMTGNRKLFSSYKAYNGGNVIFGRNLHGKIIGKGLETIVYVDSQGTRGVCSFMVLPKHLFSKMHNALCHLLTTKVEYVSAGRACQQALWMKQALVDYGVRLDDIPIMCDNKVLIDLRISLIDIGLIGQENIADILTKPLKHEPVNYLRLGLGMMEQID
ncbi:hypothetical protein Tco_0200735 [Tanacetum coccineum]